MEATFLTREEIIAHGFKQDYPHFYKGTKKDPEAIVRYYLVDELGGRKVKLFRYSENNPGQIEVRAHGKIYRIQTWMLREKVTTSMFPKPKQLELRGKIARMFVDAALEGNIP